MQARLHQKHFKNQYQFLQRPFNPIIIGTAAPQNHNQLILEFRLCWRKNAAPRQRAAKPLHYKTVMVDLMHALLIGFSQNDFVNLFKDKTRKIKKIRSLVKTGTQAWRSCSALLGMLDFGKTNGWIHYYSLHK